MSPVVERMTDASDNNGQWTAERLYEIFEAALIPCRLDEKGVLCINDNGIKYLVVTDRKRKRITFVSLWHIKPYVPEVQKLRLANTLNNKLILVRFSVLDVDTLCCDYDLLCSPDLTSYEIIAAYRLFKTVVAGAVMANDPNNIIGTD